MSAVDPFTAASQTYGRAASLGARPMPLAAGEVATFRRRPSLYGSALKGLFWLGVFLLALWAVGVSVG